MLRFKRLSKEELTVLEKQFVSFLAAQSILAADWERIKKTDPERGESIIEDFSDLVYGSVMRDARFLERKTHRALYCYQCLVDRFVLIALEVDKNSDVDLSAIELTHIKTIASDTQMHIYTSEKMYVKAKEDEVFALMELGCEITDGGMFKLLGLLL
jgi:uncharacterized protein DUF6495